MTDEPALQCPRCGYDQSGVVATWTVPFVAILCGLVFEIVRVMLRPAPWWVSFTAFLPVWVWLLFTWHAIASRHLKMPLPLAVAFSVATIGTLGAPTVIMTVVTMTGPRW